MALSYTSVFKFVYPAVNDTDWGEEINEELIHAVDMVLAQIAKGNGILAPAASGDILSAGTGATQITSVAVKCVINETLREVAAQTNQALTDNDINYIYANSTGTFTISTTMPTGEFCLLGVVKCESGARTYIANSAIRASTRIVMTSGAFLILNADLGSDGTAADGGIKVERGVTGADAVIQYNETDDTWEAGVVGTVYQIALLKGASDTLRHEEGGLEADVSAYDGIPRISGGATTALTQGTMQLQNLLRNGSFEIVSATVPDRWTLGGAGAAAVTDADEKIGLASVKVTRAGADTQIYRDFHDELGITYMQGRTFTMGCWVKTSTASQAALRLEDSVSSDTSGYHTGGGAWEWLTVTRTFNAAATLTRAECKVFSSDGDVRFDGAIVVEGTYCPAFFPHPNDEHVKGVHHTGTSDAGETDATYGLVRIETWTIIDTLVTRAHTFQEAFTKLLGIQLTCNAAGQGDVWITGEGTTGFTFNVATDIGTNYVFGLAIGVD